jgi:2'-5' RNA ligase
VALRLFVAIDLGEDVAARLLGATAAARALAPRARWGSGSTHLTLVFLGAVADGLAATIADTVRRLAAGHVPLTLRVGGTGTCGSRARPRVLWMGTHGDVHRLASLQADLASALQPYGSEREPREYRPHLTLARARDPHGDAGLAAARTALAAVDLGAVTVDAVTLFRSDLSPKGARHTVVARCPLGP